MRYCFDCLSRPSPAWLAELAHLDACYALGLALLAGYGTGVLTQGFRRDR